MSNKSHPSIWLEPMGEDCCRTSHGSVAYNWSGFQHERASVRWGVVREGDDAARVPTAAGYLGQAGPAR